MTLSKNVAIRCNEKEYISSCTYDETSIFAHSNYYNGRMNFRLKILLWGREADRRTSGAHIHVTPGTNDSFKVVSV